MGEVRAARATLERLYWAALAAVDGRASVRRALGERPLSGPLWITAIGKAAESMTLGALDRLGDSCAGGLLIGKHPPEDPRTLAAHGIESMTAGHPVPTADSLIAGERLIRHLAETPRDATLLFLISGGASSLVELPAAGLGLAELRRANRWLLGSGLPIAAMNRVRTALSRIKGGGLLAFLPERAARVLAISDVPGDDPRVIGSGLLVPVRDLAGALSELGLPEWLADWTDRGVLDRPASAGAGPTVELAANLDLAKRAAANAARDLGFPVRTHATLLDGNAAERAVEVARALRDGPPGVQVWGGETTVRLPHCPGRGGRNQHLALAAAVELAGRPDCYLLCAGTDGTDGDTQDAGALVDGGTLERAAVDGLDARDCLVRADSGSLLAASGDLIHTGPTGTNVMDLVLGLKR
ncbi:MAG: DUF4147 domain-containing protein [Chromatiaceae bacterium]